MVEFVVALFTRVKFLFVQISCGMWDKEMAFLQCELSHVIQVLLFVQTSSHIQSMKSAANSMISCLHCSQGYGFFPVCAFQCFKFTEFFVAL